jgi:hypothetical protein
MPLVQFNVCPAQLEARPLTFPACLRRNRDKTQSSGVISMDRFTLERECCHVVVVCSAPVIRAAHRNSESCKETSNTSRTDKNTCRRRTVITSEVGWNTLLEVAATACPRSRNIKTVYMTSNKTVKMSALQDHNSACSPATWSRSQT